MSDLVLDLAELNQLYDDLTTVQCTFEEADYTGAELSGAVGDFGGLAGRVQDFSGSWNDRREKIESALNVIWRSVHAIADTFHEVDLDLAAALQQSQ